MTMMGMTTYSYLLSNIIFMAIVSSIVSIEVSCLITYGFFVHSNPLLLFIVMVLFSQSLVPYSVVINSIFKNQRSATVIGNLIFFMIYLIILPVGISEDVSSSLNYLSFLLP